MTNKYITIDSSVLISSILKKEKYHNESKKFLNSTICDPNTYFIIPTIVYLETIHVLRKRNINNKGINQMINFFKEPILKWINLDMKFIYQFLIKTDKNNLKTSDAIICATSKIFNTDLITWDKKMIKNAKRLGIQITTPK